MNRDWTIEEKSFYEVFILHLVKALLDNVIATIVPMNLQVCLRARENQETNRRVRLQRHERARVHHTFAESNRFDDSGDVMGSKVKCLSYPRVYRAA